MTGRSWLRIIARLAERYGCKVHRTGGDHYQLVHDGPPKWSVVTSGSPSDTNAEHMLRQKLRRATQLGKGVR